MKKLSFVLFAMLVAALPIGSANAQTMDPKSQASYDVVMNFIGAMGAGDTEAMSALMADDMVWHNEGDSSLP